MCFRTYQLALNAYRQIPFQKLPTHLRNQLARSSSSIALNLAEGFGRRSRNEQRHFYYIAFGSLRESQAILELSLPKDNPSHQLLSNLAAHLYKLLQCYK